MRDKRITLLLLLSFFMLFSAFLVLVIWGYKFYSSKDAQLKTKISTISPEQDQARDSLLRLYTQTIGELEKKLTATYSGADSLEKTLDTKLTEYYTLRDELSKMLSSSKTTEDFDATIKKIEELQKSLQALQKTNRFIASENARLNQLLVSIQANQRKMEQATQSGADITNEPAARAIQPSTHITHAAPAITPPSSSAVVSTGNVSTKTNLPKPSVYVASNLSFEGVSSAKDENSLELVGSFLLQNNSSITTNDDLMIVVVQPNGKVLQKSTWESGTFQTSMGKKIYSCKLPIENLTPGKNRIVTFSLLGDKSLPGIYTIEIYQKGIMIGNLYKRV